MSLRTADHLVAAFRAELVRGWKAKRTGILALLLARFDTGFVRPWKRIITALPWER
jgi:hypothetical protein